jgi:hypothetical protein
MNSLDPYNNYISLFNYANKTTHCNAVEVFGNVSTSNQALSSNLQTSNLISNDIYLSNINHTLYNKLMINYNLDYNAIKDIPQFNISFDPPLLTITEAQAAIDQVNNELDQVQSLLNTAWITLGIAGGISLTDALFTNPVTREFLIDGLNRVISTFFSVPSDYVPI